jgi:peptide/nickel transport system permease protein
MVTASPPSTSAPPLAAGSLSTRAPARSSAGLSYWGRAARHLRRDRLSLLAGGLLGLVALLSVGAPLIGAILHLDPEAQALLARLEAPSARHWLGTDELGRDVLIRVLYAGQVSLLIGVLATATALVVGVSLGVLAGFYRGWVDDAINALIQTTVNIPLLFLLILLSVIFSPGVLGLAIILGLLSWQGTARQVRAMVLSVSQRDYIAAARVLGSTNTRLMVRHVLPNVLAIVLVVAGFDVAGAILAESGLSALGLGVQPPTASWGNMLAKSFQYALKAPWLVASPGVMIFLTVLSVFLSADGLRDALDPRLT